MGSKGADEQTMQFSLTIICGRRLIGKSSVLMQGWSGAVICPAVCRGKAVEIVYDFSSAR
jgi:hypothetical protein